LAWHPHPFRSTAGGIDGQREDDQGQNRMEGSQHRDEAADPCEHLGLDEEQAKLQARQTLAGTGKSACKSQDEHQKGQDTDQMTEPHVSVASRLAGKHVQPNQQNLNEDRYDVWPREDHVGCANAAQQTIVHRRLLDSAQDTCTESIR
jgi:hypothetical protein